MTADEKPEPTPLEIARRRRAVQRKAASIAQAWLDQRDPKAKAEGEGEARGEASNTKAPR